MTYRAVLDWIEDYEGIFPTTLMLHLSKTLRKKVTRELAAATRLSFHTLATQYEISFDELFQKFGVLAAEREAKHLSTPVMLITAANDEETLNKVLDGSTDQMLPLINVLESNLTLIAEASGQTIAAALTTLLEDVEAFISSERELFLTPRA